MKVTIRTIDKVLFTDSAKEINLPGLYGRIGIRPHHASMSVVLCEGEIHVKLANSTENFTIQGGIAHVGENTVDVLLAE